MKRTSMVLTLSFVVCLPGFSQQSLAADNEGISLSSLPAVVQEVVKREFARIRVTQIDDGEYDGIPVYEIEAEMSDGRDLQIEVGKDGTLYQKEEELRKQDLPLNIVIAIHREIGNAEPEDIKRISERGKVFYELEAQLQDEEVKLKIGADGTTLEKEVEEKEDDDDDDDEEVVPPPAWDPTAEPGSDGLPLQYIGPDLPDREAPDGRLMYSPGVQNIQVARANRKYPPPFPEGTENEKGWTYQHHVGMGEWKGKLYGIWDMTHVGEDNPPVRVVYATSDDG
ncbi:MAG: hypothetical protein ACYS76_15110, partial [Planctomycetota bacterium]